LKPSLRWWYKSVENEAIFRYMWDAGGNSVSIDSIGLTFDALDRIAEENSGGTYTQFVYGPDGSKLLLMNGQTLNRERAPLPGGGNAVYTSGPTLLRYWHANWQGSIRARGEDRESHGCARHAPAGHGSPRFKDYPSA